MRPLLLSLLLLLLPAPALLAQPAAPAAPAPPNWSWGLRGGVGLSAHPDEGSYTLWSGGGLVGCYLPRARFSLVAEALLEARRTERRTAGGKLADEIDPYLFLPVGIRTGQPNTLAHLLLQVGPALALGSPAPSVDNYRFRTLSAVAVVGVELRLNPRAQPHEVLLGLHLHRGLTPAANLPDPYFRSGISGPENQYFWWTGLTLSWVWHRDGTMPK